jgi:Rv0078B-related antitoxin
MVSPSDAAAERLVLALELYEVGERMLRQRLHRERPHATAGGARRGGRQVAATAAGRRVR